MNLPEKLLAAGALRVQPSKPLRLSSGLFSPVYCDVRHVTGLPELRDEVAIELAKKAEEMGANLVAGVATAGISWAALVAQKMGAPMVFVRGARKHHGTGRLVEGHVPVGSKAVVIEDLFSTGGSAAEAATNLAEHAEVIGALAVVSWELPTLQQTSAQAGIPFSALIRGEQVVAAAQKAGDITAEQASSAMAFLQDPKGWSDAQQAAK